MLPKKTKEPKAFGKLLRRFRRTNKGSTAIEFAFIITPFLMLTLGTLEIALIHLARSSMSNAMERSTRQIMTGQAACMTADQFIDELCSEVSMLSGSCKANTKVVMEELSTFASAPSNPPNDFASINSDMEAGRGGSIMLLRSYHRWTVMFPLLDDALGGGDGELMLVSNLAFKNEPFGASQGCTPPTP